MIEYLNNFKERGNRLKIIESIRTIIDQGQFTLAISEMEKYLITYEDDCEILYYYGKMLRKIGRVDEAIATFKRLLKYQKDFNVNSYLDSSKLEFFKVYFINDYYEEAYALFQIIKNEIKDKVDWNLSVVEKVLKIKLGIYNRNNDEDSTVILRMLDYDKDLALSHIKKHLTGSDEDKSMFKDVDINLLFDLVQKIIPESKKVQTFNVLDTYLFYFPGIGQNKYNRLKVITNKGTNEIVSMYPVDDSCKNFINTNLYDEYLLKTSSKVKVLTPTERFRMRYSKNG